MRVNEMRGDLFHQMALESTGDATSVGNLPLFRAPYDLQITAVSLIPSAAITANGTNFATYTLTRSTALGASQTTVATRSWAATNSVALAEESMTLSATAANLLMEAGTNLAMVKTEDGSGLIIPNLLVVITYRWTGV